MNQIAAPAPLPTRTAPVVFLVQDDDVARDACAASLRAEGFAVEAFASPESMLQAHPGMRGNCLVVDDEFGGISGLNLLQRLTRSQLSLPTVFLMGRATPALRVAALSWPSVVAALEKPVRPEALVRAVRAAISGKRAAV